jgi:galactokinase
MTTQHKKLWTTLVTLSIGILAGVGATVVMLTPPSIPETHIHADSQHDNRLAKIEEAMTALTRAVHTKPTNTTCPEPTQVALPANAEASFQKLAQLMRNEIRQAAADMSPENQRAREEAMAEAKILNSPENHVAYQTASSVVTTAVAAKRWTEDDRESFTSAVGLLTSNQRMELMDRLIPAVNNGHVKVEVNGPLF